MVYGRAEETNKTTKMGGEGNTGENTWIPNRSYRIPQNN